MKNGYDEYLFVIFFKLTICLPYYVITNISDCVAMKANTQVSQPNVTYSADIHQSHNNTQQYGTISRFSQFQS